MGRTFVDCFSRIDGLDNAIRIKESNIDSGTQCMTSTLPLRLNQWFQGVISYNWRMSKMSYRIDSIEWERSWNCLDKTVPCEITDVLKDGENDLVIE